MTGIGKFFGEGRIRLAFKISLWIKGAFALTEIAGGVAAFFVTQRLLAGLASAIVQGELAEDPRDLVANYLLHSVQGLSIGTQHFAAVYLLSHGVIKLWLIAGLLRERLRYYPAALIVFGLLIFYQLYRFAFSHSLWLLLITAVDVAVVALTWHEYRYMRRSASCPG